LQMGMIYKVVEDDKLQIEAMAIAKTLSQKSLHALKVFKKETCSHFMALLRRRIFMLS